MNPSADIKGQDRERCSICNTWIEATPSSNMFTVPSDSSDTVKSRCRCDRGNVSRRPSTGQHLPPSHQRDNSGIHSESSSQGPPSSQSPSTSPSQQGSRSNSTTLDRPGHRRLWASPVTLPSTPELAAASHQRPIPFINIGNTRQYSEPESDAHESEFWKTYSSDPRKALQSLELRRNDFPEVMVTSKRRHPLFNKNKPSISAMLYILVAAGGPMSVDTAKKVIPAYYKSIKDQTIRKAFSSGQTFARTADNKAWTIPREENFQPRLKNKGGKRKLPSVAPARDAAQSVHEQDVPRLAAERYERNLHSNATPHVSENDNDLASNNNNKFPQEKLLQNVAVSALAILESQDSRSKKRRMDIGFLLN